METNYLKEFILISKLLSFSKAAEELNISQSSLSKHIKALESDLGVLLFDRTTRSIVLTPIGQEILKLGTQMSELHDEIIDRKENYINQSRNHVKLISIPVMAQYNITKCISSFIAVNKDIRISFSEIESQSIENNLRHGGFEIAFTRLINPDPDFETLPYYRDCLVAIVPTHHPLAKRKIIDIKELNNEKFVLLDEHTMLYDYIIDILKKNGVTPNVQQTSHRIDNIVDFIGQNFGISLLFRRQYEFANKSNTVLIEIKDAPTSLIVLKKLANHRLSYAAKKFWDYVGTYYSDTN